MLSTSGELLCFCDMRKLQWYVDRGLAERVQQEPPTIRLLFEHKNADQQVGSCRLDDLSVYFDIS
jgi:cation-transporting P-type ATPase D